MKFRSLVIVFTMLATLAFAGGPLQVDAQQTPAAARGTAGNSYQSSTFGFGVAWDTSWERKKATTGTGHDTLELSNGKMVVYFEGYESDAQTTAQALTAAAKELGREQGVSNFTSATDSSGKPIQGQDSTDAWALYNLDYTPDSGAVVHFVGYVRVRLLVSGQSVLQITALTRRDDYNSQVSALTKLVANLTISSATAQPTPTPTKPPTGTEPAGDTMSLSDLRTFTQRAAADIDGFWRREFPNLDKGKTYSPPKAYKDYGKPISTPCDTATPGSLTTGDGPFYCPTDDTIYVDLLFAQDQASKFGGLFVVAEAIAHEVGHHVQDLMGLKECTQSPCLDPSQVTSLELETMADCFAGAWAQDAEQRGRLGEFDIESNIAEYALVFGNESSTADPGVHGRGALRTYWFLEGYFHGAPSCLAASQATASHAPQ